ncbi:hypothetical protein GCM10027269_26730 [Kribbella endophytica]
MVVGMGWARVVAEAGWARVVVEVGVCPRGGGGGVYTRVVAGVGLGGRRVGGWVLGWLWWFLVGSTGLRGRC